MVTTLGTVTRLHDVVLAEEVVPLGGKRGSFLTSVRKGEGRAGNKCSPAQSGRQRKLSTGTASSLPLSTGGRIRKSDGSQNTSLKMAERWLVVNHYATSLTNMSDWKASVIRRSTSAIVIEHGVI